MGLSVTADSGTVRSDAKHKGCRPEGRFVAMRETRVITDLLHEQLAKYLDFLCCVPQRDTSLKPLGKGYHAASLLAPALKRTGCLISELTWSEGRARFCLQDQDWITVDP